MPNIAIRATWPLQKLFLEIDLKVSDAANPGRDVPKPDFRCFVLLVGCFLVNAIYGSYLGAIGLLLPRIGASLHLNSLHQGRIMSAGFAGSVVSVLICGSASDRLGRKRVLVIAGSLFAAGLFLVGLGASELSITLAAPLIGAGSAGMQTVAAALASDLYSHRRSQVLNACQVAFAAGAVFGPLIVARMMSGNTEGWHTAYELLGLLAALTTAAFATTPIQEHKPGILDAPSVGLAGLIAAPAFILLCAAQLFYAGAEVGYFEWMPTFLARPRGVVGGEAWSASVVSVFWIGMTLGRLAMAPLLHRFRPPSLGIFLSCSGAFFASLGIFAETAVYIVAAVFFTGLCFGGVYSSILVEAGTRFHKCMGAAIGGIAAASSCGTSTIPWAIGALALTRGGWKGGLILAPISAFLCACILSYLLCSVRPVLKIAAMQQV